MSGLGVRVRARIALQHLELRFKSKINKTFHCEDFDEETANKRWVVRQVGMCQIGSEKDDSAHGWGSS